MEALALDDFCRCHLHEPIKLIHCVVVHPTLTVFASITCGTLAELWPAFDAEQHCLQHCTAPWRPSPNATTLGVGGIN